MDKPSLKLICILFKTLALCGFPNFALGNFPQGRLSELIEQRITSLTIEEKVGQLFMIGFPHTEISPELFNFLHTHKPGAFILFKRNILSVDQIKSLNSQLYSLSYQYSNLPPLLAVDQEGGSVSRLPIHPPSPPKSALGNTALPVLAERMGREAGLFLREVGFNFNLAPVLDISKQTNSFIGLRSFGGDPQLVAEMGSAYSKGLLESRVLPTAKHFPGTGSVKADPHNTIVTSSADIDQLRTKHLLPFKEFIKIDSDKAIMLSHLLYPTLDSELPGTFSKKIISLLRDELKFDGLIITDDLQMESSKLLAKGENPAVKALIAGADIVMLSWSLREQTSSFKAVQKAIQDGKIPERELNRKLTRILKAKAFTNLYRRPSDLPSLSENGILSSKSYKDLDQAVLNENLRPHLLPASLPPKGLSTPSRKPANLGDLCLISSSERFISSFKESYQYPASLNVEKFFSKGTKPSYKSCSVTIAVVNNRQQGHWLNQLSQKQRGSILVINQAHPDFVTASGFYKKVDLYFEHQNSGKKIAQHLDDLLRDYNFKISMN